MAQSRAALCPSLCYESFALIPAEAHAVGTPVLASDLGNVGAAVQEGIDGLHFAPGNAAALADAVRKLQNVGETFDLTAMQQKACQAYNAEQKLPRTDDNLPGNHEERKFMNQIYRALHMPPKRLIKKLSGQKKSIPLRCAAPPRGEGCDPLPALGEEPYTPLPYTPGTWYADPLLYEDDNGKRWLFCEAFNMAENRGDIAVAEFDENDHLLPPRVVLKENFHLSFPTVFDWRGEVWMLPETSADHSLTLYRCTQFPDKWEKVQAFSVGRELCDSIIVDKTPEALTVLCSETRPDNQLYTRYRRYTVRENPEAEERDDVDEFILDEDEPFNLQHRNYELGSRNAGPLFTNNDQTVRPAQVSTKVDYGVYLQFWVRRGASEVPLCAAMPQNVAIAGIDPADLIGIHTYCRDADIEVIDARYLRKV